MRKMGVGKKGQEYRLQKEVLSPGGKLIENKWYVPQCAGQSVQWVILLKNGSPVAFETI